MCGDNGIMFNEEMFQFCQLEVEFTRFHATAGGTKSSDETNFRDLVKPSVKTWKLTESLKRSH